MMDNASDQLGIALRNGLGPVSAPADLWDRMQSARMSTPNASDRRPKLAWAPAMAMVLAIAGLLWLSSPGRETRVADRNGAALRCQNPAQLRAWVRAKTGLDLPFRAELPASMELIGARQIVNGVEVDYRAANRDVAFMVSRADGRPATVAHNRSSDGPLFTLACDRTADLQLACKLCHLD